MFQGADADALDAFAAEVARAADGLDQIGTVLRTRLYAAPWHGGDADHFRQEWDGPHRARLASAAGILRAAADVLRRNASDQRIASGSDGGALIAGGLVLSGAALGGAGAFWGNVESAGRFGFKVISAPIDVAKPLIVGVDGYLRNGRYVDDYVRWRAGTAPQMTKLFGTASELHRLDKLAKFGGFAIAAVGAGAHQYSKDAGRYSGGEEAARVGGAAAFSGAAHLGMDYVKGEAVLAGAAIGTFVPIPVVGTVAGGAIGWLVGEGAEYALEQAGVFEKIGDAGAWTGSALYGGATRIVDFGGDVVDAGADLWDTGRGMAGSAVDAGAGALRSGAEAVGSVADGASDLIDRLSWRR